MMGLFYFVKKSILCQSGCCRCIGNRQNKERGENEEMVKLTVDIIEDDVGRKELLIDVGYRVPWNAVRPEMRFLLQAMNEPEIYNVEFTKDFLEKSLINW